MSVVPEHHPEAGLRWKGSPIRLVCAIAIIIMALIAGILAVQSLPADADPTILHEGDCGTDVHYTHYSDGLFSVTYVGVGEGGAMDDYQGDKPWDNYAEEITSVSIGDKVTSIGDFAFHGCTGITGTLTIPSSVKSIGSSAFCGCTGITGTLTIPSSVTSIGNEAFEGCTGITGTLTIPSSVTSIGNEAFEGCTGISCFVVDPACINHSSDDRGILYDKGKTKLIECPAGITGTLSIPNSVTSIGNYAFYGCSSLISITIPSSVTSIGREAFRGTGITGTLTIPSSVTSIGDGAFFMCSALTSITIPSSVTSIGNDEFYGCSALTSITIPSSVTSIGIGAFFMCSALTSITIPSSVTSIGNNAFAHCSSLTSIIIPNSVASIGYNAFGDCSSLTSISLPDRDITASIPDCFPDMAFHEDGETIAAPGWDDVKGKVWQGPGDGHFYHGKVKVTFDYRGGSVSTESKLVTPGEVYGPLPSSSKPGYTSAGWFTAASGGDEVASNTIVTVAWDHTLYAHWAGNEYKVTFDYGQGTGTVESETVVFDEEYGALPEAARTGYELEGWFTAASGGDEVTAETTVTEAQDHTLYAHWTANGYTVAFDPNGGEGTMEDQQFTYDVQQALSDNAFTRTGYGFAGWSETPEGEAEYTDGQSVGNLTSTPNGTVTLYAAWSPCDYTAEFDPNGGSPPSFGSKIVMYGSAYGQLPSASRTGYEFDGWFTAASGGSKVTSATKVATASDHTLYAHWSAIPEPPEDTVLVFFDSQGGTPAGSKTVTVGSAYGPLPKTTRTGYEFDGWFTAASGGIQVTSSTRVTTDADHTLYALWTKVERFTNPDGSETVREITETVNEDGSKVAAVTEVTTWEDGSSVVRESELYEKANPDGSSVMEYNETSVATDASGAVTTTELRIVSDTTPSGAVKTTEDVRIETGTETTTRTKVTDVTADGRVTVSCTVVSAVEGYSIVTTARSESTPEGTAASAVTVIKASGDAISADEAASAARNLGLVAGMLGTPDVANAITIDAKDAARVTLTGDALREFAETGLGLSFAFEDGTMRYDADALGALSQYGYVEVSMTKDDESVLTDAQRAALGGASFVSVTAMAGQTYIRDLGGTVSMTYAFANPQGWEEFAAYHIDDDGSRTAMDWTYDEATGQVTIVSTHHSIYAMLERTEGSGSGMVWIAAGIIAVLVIAAAGFYAVRSRKARSRFQRGREPPPIIDES